MMTIRYSANPQALLTTYLLKGYKVTSAGTFFGKFGAHVVKGNLEVSIRGK